MNMSLKEILNAADNIIPLEGEIRGLVRREFPSPDRQSNKPDAAASAESLNGLIQRVTGASTEQIDQVIIELQGLRKMLCGEGDRLNGEIARYASVNQAAMAAMTVIGNSLKQLTALSN